MVTGAAQGIGAAIATRLARDGMDVVRVDRQPSAGHWTTCDITDANDVARLAADVGPVDVLVNNAGIWRFAPLLDASADDVRAVLDVNVVGTLRCAQAFARQMIEAGRGSIVNTPVWCRPKGPETSMTTSSSGPLGHRRCRSGGSPRTMRRRK